MSNLLEQASLVMIPSGYKEDVVYSEIPINGAGDLSFTRASNGTRINSQGLVEVVPWNLLQESETFSNAVWTKQDSSITANATTAPNGTLTADKLVENTSTSAHSVWQANNLPNQTYTYSFYAKASERVWVYTRGDIGLNYFNVSTGVVGTTSAGATSTIENVGNGWYRCIVTKTFHPQFNTQIAISTADNIDSYTGNGTSGIFLWGAQLNIGSTAKPYFPTTDRLNVPRLTYQNGGGGCPSLLLEKQSTNDFIQSENLFTTHLVQNLTTSGNVDVATSPDGTQNADKFVPNSTSGVHGIANGSSLAITSGQTYSFSAFVKSDGGAFNLISLTFDSTTAWGATKNCIFNASTGASYSVPSGATMSSQNMGNGWYRITATLTASGSVSASLYQYRIYIADSSGNLSYAASSGNTAGIYVWGAQLEASSYSTSYIPTTSSTATRVADACFKTGISSLIGASAGTLFLYADIQKHNDADFYIAISDGASLGDAVYLYQPSSGLIQVLIRKTGNADAVVTIANANWTAGLNKVAIAYTATTIEVFMNGASKGSTTFTALPTLSQFTIGSRPDGVGTLVGTGTYLEAVVFPTRLTDSECITLTTL